MKTRRIQLEDELERCFGTILKPTPRKADIQVAVDYLQTVRQHTNIADALESKTGDAVYREWRLQIDSDLAQKFSFWDKGPVTDSFMALFWTIATAILANLGLGHGIFSLGTLWSLFVIFMYVLGAVAPLGAKRERYLAISKDLAEASIAFDSRSKVASAIKKKMWKRHLLT